MILVFTSMAIGLTPNSQYIIYVGVERFRLFANFKFFSCILSKSSRFPYPHISLPYSNIALTVLLNNLICKLIVKFRDLVFLNRVNSALFACSAKYFLLLRNDQLRDRIIPKYLYSHTIIISLFSKEKCKFSVWPSSAKLDGMFPSVFR